MQFGVPFGAILGQMGVEIRSKLKPLVRFWSSKIDSKDNSNFHAILEALRLPFWVQNDVFQELVLLFFSTLRKMAHPTNQSQGGRLENRRKNLPKAKNAMNMKTKHKGKLRVFSVHFERLLGTFLGA